jgi:hypothetical protein
VREAVFPDDTGKYTLEDGKEYAVVIKKGIVTTLAVVISCRVRKRDEAPCTNAWIIFDEQWLGALRQYRTIS